MKPTNIQPKSRFLKLEATDVTGMHVCRPRNIQPSSPAGEVARYLAKEMALPTDISWILRNDRTGGFLDEEKAIGLQIDDGSQVAVVPRAHLG